jgi:hypothetical protein
LTSWPEDIQPSPPIYAQLPRRCNTSLEARSALNKSRIIALSKAFAFRSW